MDDNKSNGTTSESSDGAGIFGKAVCLTISFHKIGVRRKTKTAKLDQREDAKQVKEHAEELLAQGRVLTDADAEWVSASKRILDLPAVRELYKFDSEVKRYINDKCLPVAGRIGLRLLPIKRVEEVDGWLLAAKVRRNAIIDKIEETYDEGIANAEAKLGPGQFSITDYVPKEELRGHFAMTWQMVEFSTPASLKGISKEIWAREREKAAAHWKEAGDEVRGMLRALAKGLLDNFLESLAAGSSGKKRVITQPGVTKLTAFLAGFNDKNLTDDDELEKCVETMRDLMEGVDAEGLRESDALRDAVFEELQKMKPKLEQLVVDAPLRDISFFDE